MAIISVASKMTVRDVDFRDKRVVMRVDYNVPVKGTEITDYARVNATKPTLDFIIAQQPKSIVLLAHFGRPKGEVNMKYSFKPLVDQISKALGIPLKFLDDCVGEQTLKTVQDASPGTVFMAENVRFHKEEEDTANATEFQKQLSQLGEIYVNDAFGAAHRAHSSVTGIDLPIKCAGLLMEKEMKMLTQPLLDPKRPVLAILGGAKVADKIQLIENLLDLVDLMIIGGGMAYTFLKVLKQMEIGASLYDDKGAAIVPRIMEKAKAKNVEILLPEDFVCADAFKADANIKTVTVSEGMQSPWMGVDCGPKSRENNDSMIAKAKTIIWNGPQGVFEMEPFAKGSLTMLDAVAAATENGCITIVGGGDTASLVSNAGKADKMCHVSTGGGATLELLEGKPLPGLVGLSEKK